MNPALQKFRRYRKAGGTGIDLVQLKSSEPGREYIFSKLGAQPATGAFPSFQMSCGGLRTLRIVQRRSCGNIAWRVGNHVEIFFSKVFIAKIGTKFVSTLRPPERPRGRPETYSTKTDWRLNEMPQISASRLSRQVTRKRIRGL
jgi:hypothetical protein